MALGVLYLLAACLCWSFIFVIPSFIKGFSPIEIALGRYFVFGLISASLVFIKKRSLLNRTYWPVWKKSIWMGFLSTVASYTFTVICIQYANSATAALLFGTVPILVALCGNRRKKEFPFSFLWIPCVVMGMGVVICNIEVFHIQSSSIITYLLGLFGGILGIVCWVWYLLASCKFMENNPQVSSTEWVMMIGSSVFFLVLLIGMGCFVAVGGDVSKYLSFSEELLIFLGSSVVLGIIASWLALYFWTKGNQNLPISVAGQLTVFELIFGLALIYVAEHRLPNLLETAGVVLMLGGVLYGMSRLKNPPYRKLE